MFYRVFLKIKKDEQVVTKKLNYDIIQFYLKEMWIDKTQKIDFKIQKYAFIPKFDNKCRGNTRDGIVLSYIGLNLFFRISALIIIMVLFVIPSIYKLVW